MPAPAAHPSAHHNAGDPRPALAHPRRDATTLHRISLPLQSSPPLQFPAVVAVAMAMEKINRILDLQDLPSDADLDPLLARQLLCLCMRRLPNS
jgi:hypothetical protein